MMETIKGQENGAVQATLFLPEKSNGTVVYVHTEKEEAQRLWPAVNAAGAALVCLEGADWNRDFSPWPAPRAFRKGEDFAGGAGAYLRYLTEKQMPAVERALGFSPVRRYITGYSLAGLFALYAACETSLFHGAASVSGSLWYDGWLDYFRRRPLPGTLQSVYLSVGDREKNVRNARMATVEDCTRAAADHLRAQGIQVCFEHNSGGHFDDPTGRLQKGICALLTME